MNVLVIGLGISGESAREFLEREGHSVHGFDDKAAPEPPPWPPDLIVLSPGVPPTHPLLQGATCPVIGEAELALRHLPCRAVGITGTNGKTTTTLLTSHILQELGHDAHALGNVGRPLTGALDKLTPESVAVIELSSFQLETAHARALNAAAILNITPDHLDRYDSFTDYVRAKQRIGRLLKPQAPLYVEAEAQRNFPMPGAIALPEKLDVETIVPMRYRESGSPDRENGLAAYALCSTLVEVPQETFREAWKTFKSPPHRLERVGELDGVTYVNDSKGTNIAATAKAVQGLNGPIYLIAGGKDKGSSYEPWIEAFREKVDRILAIGEASEKIEQALNAAYAVERHTSLEEALDAAHQAAKEGATILLSPGCASYDMFENYAARGERFKQLVAKLKENRA